MEKERALRRAELEEVLQEMFRKKIHQALPKTTEFKKILDEVLEGKISSYEAAHRIFPKI